MRVFGAALCLLLACPLIASGQQSVPTDRGGITTSLGLPSSWKLYGGFNTGRWRREEPNELVFYLSGSVYHDLVNPLTGVIGMQLDGYVGSRSTEPDGGIRALLRSPTLRLAGGVDWNFRDNEADFVLSLIHPMRRGGILVGGGTLRIDWLPGRGHSTNVGLQLPLGGKMGRTRPASDLVIITDPQPTPIRHDNRDPGMDEAIAHVAEAAHWVNRLTTPFIDHGGGSYEEGLERFAESLGEITTHFAGGSPLIQGQVSSNAYIETYHKALDRAFSIALGSASLPVGESTAAGRQVSEAARRILLHEVLIPYDRTLGQKKREDTTAEFAVRARGQLLRWLHATADVPDGRAVAAAWVFERLLEIVETEREASYRDWGNRFVWLPYQWGLKPDQHDTQTEIDRLIEASVGVEFKDGNRVWYVINEQFQWEQARMILEAEDYHVLWIHDIRGNNAEGQPDEMGYALTRAYLEGLNQAVERYDDTGKIPAYFVFIDQWFYEVNNGRRYLEFLEAPLDRDLDLPDGYEAWADTIRTEQERLRVAVASSRLLQGEVLQYGEHWLDELIKVHVNVTNPSDPSFWSPEILPIIGLPDNAMRDHRKIAFFDITEADPYRGRAIYTGMGIGEHYTGASWEDRAVLGRGPAFLTLKDAARQLLVNQGFTDDDIPWPLREKAKPANYDEMVARGIEEFGTRSARALELHNQVGMGPKPINVAKAVLYSLMPPGFVLKAPDSLWNSPLWGSFVMGASLRGGRILVIAPSIASAPSNGFPQMSRAHELLARLMVFGNNMAQPIADAGGLLKLGMYDPEVGVANIPGRVRMFKENLDRHAWLRDLYGFDPAVYEALDGVLQEFDEQDFAENYLFDREPTQPMLHLKAHFFASETSWGSILSMPEWGDILATYHRERALQIANPLDTDYQAFADAVGAVARPPLLDLLGSMSEDELDRMIMFFLVGAQNQNIRSMVIDGEVMVVMSEWAALIGLIDMMFIAGQSKWIDDHESLNELLPEYSGLQRRIARWIKLML